MTVATAAEPETNVELSARRVYRERYRAPAFRVQSVDLLVDLALPTTRVEARTRFQRDGRHREALVLDGEQLYLSELHLDGCLLDKDAYRICGENLVIFDVPDQFELLIVTQIEPGSASEGLIHLEGAFISHCEPHGFRRITYFPDRPDVMARFDCTLTADAAEYPVLLSNGHCVERGSLADGRHFARWSDPHPKASYLFALAAGRFTALEDRFVTADGRSVRLAVHSSVEDSPSCSHGLATLKKAMAWDERAYGRLYDLDELNVVVLRSYPGGAMENKGLNLYASEFFLASPTLSTDEEMGRVTETVAHEYFHNWTGNRVGCRDWFQLALKEGFTVFRQQQFMADCIGEAAARIEAIERLFEHQFPEDEGGLAHAVRPDSYGSVNNLYTRTVYNKGAELVRMVACLLGDELFRRTTDAFFDRFDGRAVTIDDWLDVAGEVSGIDLSGFRRWYEVVGRPVVTVTHDYDPETKVYSLSLSQSLPDGTQSPLTMPVAFGLMDEEGVEVTSGDLVLEASTQRLEFPDLERRPIPSLFRNFSAPVDVRIEYDVAERLAQAFHDRDPVNRWLAAQDLAAQAILDDCANAKDAWLTLFSRCLADATADPSFACRLLKLPSDRQLSRLRQVVDVDTQRAGRFQLASLAARKNQHDLRALYSRLARTAGEDDGIAPRRMREVCLFYLMHEDRSEDRETCMAQFDESWRMEEQFAALRLLVSFSRENRDQTLESAYLRWRQVPQALDQWFAVHACADADDCASLVEKLSEHSDYSLKNATRLKAIFDNFGMNYAGFHDPDGRGYRCISRLTLALDPNNPRLAARFFKSFNGWSRFDPGRRALMLQSIEEVSSAENLSRDVRDVAELCLKESE